MKKKIVILILAIVSIFVYGNTLFNGLIWDDEDLIIQDRGIRIFKTVVSESFSPQYWKKTFTEKTGVIGGRYRPLRRITFAFDYFLWKNKPFGYHLSNLLLHLVCVVLVWIFGLHILKDEKAAFISALIFAVLPVHTESVAWVKNRSDILCCIFYLLSFIFFVKNRGTDAEQDAKLTQNLSIVYRLSSIVCFILALLSKEMAVTLPIVIGLYIFLFADGKISKNRISVFIAIFLIYIFFFLTAVGIGKTSVNILLVPETVIEYLKLLLLPFDLKAARIVELPKNIITPNVILFIGVIAVGVMLLKQKKSAKISFAYWWILITLLPVSNIIYLEGRSFAEQRLYIPSVGFSMLLGIVFSEFIGRKSVNPVRNSEGSQRTVSNGVKITLGFLLAFYSAQTVVRNTDWKDDLKFWLKTTEQSPQIRAAWNNLGVALSRRGMYKQAARVYNFSLNQTPADAKSLYNLSYVYIMNNQLDDALKLLEKAVEVAPDDYKIRSNFGIAFDKKGLYKEAIKQFEVGLSINPSSAELYYNLGIACENDKQFTKAEDCYKKAIVLDPANPHPHNALGVLYENLGKIKEALEEYKKAMELAPQIQGIKENYERLRKEMSANSRR